MVVVRFILVLLFGYLTLNVFDLNEKYYTEKYNQEKYCRQEYTQLKDYEYCKNNFWKVLKVKDLDLSSVNITEKRKRRINNVRKFFTMAERT